MNEEGIKKQLSPEVKDYLKEAERVTGCPVEIELTVTVKGGSCLPAHYKDGLSANVININPEVVETHLDWIDAGVAHELVHITTGFRDWKRGEEIRPNTINESLSDQIQNTAREIRVIHQTHKRFKNLRCKHADMITTSTRELAKGPGDKSALWLAAAYYLKKFSIIDGKAYRSILEKAEESAVQRSLRLSRCLNGPVYTAKDRLELVRKWTGEMQKRRLREENNEFV